MRAQGPLRGSGLPPGRCQWLRVERQRVLRGDQGPVQEVGLGAHHGLSAQDHQARFDSLPAQGFRSIHVSVYTVGGSSLLARGGIPAQHASRIDKTPIGYDWVHSLIDDHSRFAYSEILADEKGATCRAFLLRAAAHFAAHGISQIERVMTDNAWAYRYSLRGGHHAPGREAGPSSVRTVPGRRARSNASTAPCRANGRTDRCSPRTRSAPRLRPGSSTTTHLRRHSGLGGRPPISRVSAT